MAIEPRPDRYSGPWVVVDLDTNRPIEGHAYEENALHAVEVLNRHEEAHGRLRRYAVVRRPDRIGRDA